jgi:hypothetical protein
MQVVNRGERNMPSKDFLITEPGLTYLYLSQRLTASDVAKMQQEFGEDAFTLAPYSQQLQRTLKAQYKKEYAFLAN